MPTTLLQVPRRTFGRLRVLPQVSRHLLWRLRVLPQVSRHLLWRLRESRKSRGIYFDVCGYSRRSPGICFDVCGYSRKFPGIYFGVCGSPASLAAFALAFAGVPQVFRRTCWPLQHAINDILNKGISFFRQTHVCLPSAEAFCGPPELRCLSGSLREANRVLVLGRAGLYRGWEVCLVQE